MTKTTTTKTQTKPRKRAIVIVKRQYAGNQDAGASSERSERPALDMEKAFTEVLTRALYKIPMQQPQHKEPCLSQTLK